MDNIHLLRQKIIDSRAGLHNNRAENIMRFSEFFWRHPFWFNQAPGETWPAYRNRIMERAPGIGRAKAAFLLELVYLHKSEIACFDTHMLQLYGFDQNRVKDSQFDHVEQHWSKVCLAHKVSPCTARWIFWDIKQKKLDSRYWTYVLEAA
jgi:endonuclease III